MRHGASVTPVAGQVGCLFISCDVLWFTSLFGSASCQFRPGVAKRQAGFAGYFCGAASSPSSLVLFVWTFVCTRWYTPIDVQMRNAECITSVRLLVMQHGALQVCCVVLGLALFMSGMAGG